MSFLKAPKLPELERDENGKSFLTHAYVQALCEYNGQFYTPKCVDKLYLHFKGKLFSSKTRSIREIQLNSFVV